MASEHGTVGAYQQHRLSDEDPCDPCKAAWNAYHRDYKKTRLSSAAKEKANLRTAATSRALRRRRAENPKRFLELLTEELAK